VSQALAEPIAAPREAELTFDQLYRSSRDDVYAYAAGLLRDPVAAEDVTATAFERAYRKRSRFDPKRGSGRAWLFGIARNAALDELRRRGRHAELAADPEDAASPASSSPPPWRSSTAASGSWSRSSSSPASRTPRSRASSGSPSRTPAPSCTESSPS
jgi:RNA polymerase sigma-70 factor (ECF subfamily)